jgi:protein-tyrosine kinase
MSAKPALSVEGAARRLPHLGLLEGCTEEALQVEHRSAPRPESPGAHAVLRPVGDVADLSTRELPQEPDQPSRMPRCSIIGMTALERAGMFDWRGERRRILEEFRLVQRQLLRAAFETTAQPGIANLVMVTSARPGEGKSFLSLNLACSIALQGDYDVLLIDCDPSRQSICQALGLVDASGILDLAADPRLGADDVILRTEVENLSVLPIGSERGRSSELLASRHIAQLLQQLGHRYANRLVILDAAPCLSTSDPAALASAVGQILMVVQAEQTQREEVEAALELVQACPSIMLVLNKAHASNRHTFGAYSGGYSF